LQVVFEASFARDLKRIKDRRLRERVRQIIEEAKNAENLGEIKSLNKISGYKTFYRIRFGDYRVGIEVVKGEIIFVRVLHRKEIYRYFP
jgi:mRNA interferase RelE/StbE